MVVVNRLRDKELPQAVLEMLVDMGYKRAAELYKLQSKMPKPTYTSGKGIIKVPEHKIIKFY